MKKIALLTLAAVIGSLSIALASSPASCPSDGACAASTCCEVQCAAGETVAAAQERVMAAELTRLVARYVSDPAIRSELPRALKNDPERDFAAVAKVFNELRRHLAAFSETDRASFKRLTGYFIC
jgi:hypothetical protein